MHQKPVLTRPLLWIMTISSGLIVANNYYNQPLLSLMAKDFDVSESSISNSAMLTQMGFAAGLLFIVPMGDMLKRKKMILVDMLFVILALFGMAYSPSAGWVYPMSFLIGFTSVIPQILVPMAAELSVPEKKSAAVGMVMSGLLIGILLSRVVSGFVGAYIGWREMYWIAGLMMVLMLLVLWKTLPEISPVYKGNYKGLMRSVLYFARTEPVLQLASFRGATAFATFSVFWTTLVFHMEETPFHAGADIVGLFGLVGASGAFAAVFIGGISHRVNRFRIILYSILLILAGWLFFYVEGNTYWGLIVGVILLDFGLQALHVMNQSAIFSIREDANNRINTVYMTSYFIGGALGTFIAAHAWQYKGWTGVVIVGTIFTLLTLSSHLLFAKR